MRTLTPTEKKKLKRLSARIDNAHRDLDEYIEMLQSRAQCHTEEIRMIDEIDRVLIEAEKG